MNLKRLTARSPALRENSIWGSEKLHPNRVHHLSILLPATAAMDRFSKWTRRVVLKAVLARRSRDVSPQV